ncbi:MAG: autotransporter domain-containing protein [Myxococcota bacterium]
MALAEARTDATAEARAIDAGDGADRVENDADVRAEADADALALAASFVTQGAALGLSPFKLDWSATETAGAEATGIDGGAGNDAIVNRARVEAESNADAISVDGTLALEGVAGAVAGNRADARAVGIDAGDAGDGEGASPCTGPCDTVENEGTVVASANAEANAAALTVTGKGLALTVDPVWDAGTTAEAGAAGLFGGDGATLLWNGGLLDVDAEASSRIVDATVAVEGVAVTITSTHAESRADGAAAGGGGDLVENDARVEARAQANAEGYRGTFSKIGGALTVDPLWDAGTAATARARGLAGEDGDDVVTNRDVVDVRAEADTRSVSLSGSVTGVAATLAVSQADAHATGLDGGDGRDAITNDGQVIARADADAQAFEGSLTWTGVSATLAPTADLGTHADARATGLAGGASADLVVDRGSLDVDADADVLAISGSFTATGLAVTIATQEASSRASGVDGGGGSDRVEAHGTLDVDARADAESYEGAIAINGGAFSGDVSADAGTRADAGAAGLAGGSGRDTLVNQTSSFSVHAEADAESNTLTASYQGLAVSAAVLHAEADATGLDGGEGGDWLDNQTDLDATARADTRGVSVTLSGLGVSGNADLSRVAEARATGLDGGAGDDVLENAANVFAGATAVGRATAVAVNAVGAPLISAEQLGVAEATALAGGDGDDALLNQGSVDARANARAEALGISVGLLGISGARAHITAEADAAGIDGGAGDDLILNQGSVHARADATAETESVSVQLGGLSLEDQAARAVARAAGLRGGGGADRIESDAAITVVADAEATSDTVDVSLVGFSGTGASVEAEAHASGIEGGSADEEIVNRALLDVLADAEMEADGLSVDILGGGTLEAAGEATARASGASTLAGDDLLWNEATLRVRAEAEADSDGDAVEILGASGTSAVLTADAAATGASLGDGADAVVNLGLLDVDARGDAASQGDILQVIGGTTADGSMVGLASATGLDTGEGDDFVSNQGTADVDAVALADTSGDSLAPIGASGADGRVTARASAWGVQAGGGNDVFENTGDFFVTSHADPDADAESGGFFADGFARAGGSSHAGGLALGDGGDTATNDGSFAVRAELDTDADAEGDGVGTDADARGGGSGSATGIDAGAGNDRITNRGSFSAITAFFVDADAETDGADARSDADITASAAASGFRLGAGDDVAVNEGSLVVRADLDPDSDAEADGGGARADADRTGTVSALGLAGESGDDEVWNPGSVSVVAHVDPDADGEADGLDATGDAQSTGNATATGFDLGDGDDRVVNDGSLTVTADPNVDAEGDGTGADGDADAESDATATANGMLLGAGNDVVENRGSLSVLADPDADSDADGDGADGDGDAESDAVGTALGFHLGSGDDRLDSSGSVSVVAIADAEAVSDGDAFGDAESDGNATARATGVVGDAGDDTITLSGPVTVRAHAEGLGDADGGSEGDSDSDSRASAVAVGIDTGAGDDVVVVEDSLHVSARAEIPVFVPGAGSSIGSSATAISTGDGDDRVEVYGSVVARRERQFIDLSDIFDPELVDENLPDAAILTGSGDDVLVLGAGAHVEGRIELGPDDDTATLLGNVSLDHDILGESGFDTIGLENSGAFTRRFVGFEALRKTTPGTFSLTQTPGGIRDVEVTAGTIALPGAFAFPSGGSFLTRVEPNGDHGRLALAGPATLAGEIEVLRSPGYYADGSTWRVITASTLVGAFDDVVLPAPTPLLSFDVTNETGAPGPAVVVRALAIPFEAFGANRLQRQVGGYLDAIGPDATGDLAMLLGAFQQAPLGQIPQAYTSLSPTMYDGGTRVAFDADRACARSMLRRLDRVRQRGTASAWGEAGADWSDQSGGDGHLGFDARSGGGSGGLDRALRDGVVGGLGICGRSARLDFDTHAGRSEVDTLGGFAYGSWYGRHAFLDGAIGYARQDFRERRRVTVDTIVGPASSSHEGYSFSIAGSTGARVSVREVSLEPFASLTYTSLDQDGFTEQGLSGATLAVDSRRTDALVGEVGLRVAHRVAVGPAVLAPRVSAAWSHDYQIEDREITARIQGAPSGSMTVRGQDVDADSARVDAGIGVEWGSVGAWIDYRGDFRGDRSENGFAIGVEWLLP